MELRRLPSAVFRTIIFGEGDGMLRLPVEEETTEESPTDDKQPDVKSPDTNEHKLG